MTVYSMTISNSLRAFGGGPTSLWNAYNWNAFKWGEGTVKIPMKSFVHLVATEALGFGSARYFRLVKRLQDETLTYDSARSSYALAKVISESLSLDSDTPHQYLTDSAGYYHDFPGGVTDANSRVNSSWSDGSSTTPTWSSSTASSTSWSAG